MSFYERRILPHILNLAMNTKVLDEERTRCLQDLKGVVLEIGFGTGLNLPHYPRTVTKVVGVDPSETSAKLARNHFARRGCNLFARALGVAAVWRSIPQFWQDKASARTQSSRDPSTARRRFSNRENSSCFPPA